MKHDLRWLIPLPPIMFGGGLIAALVGWPNPYIAMSLAGGAWTLFATYWVGTHG